MALSLQFAVAFSEYLTSALKDYAANFDKHGVKALEEPGYEKSEAYMRASTFSHDKCAKRVAAEDVGLVAPAFSEGDLWKFALAHYAAMLAKVAIKTRIEADNEQAHKVGDNWSVSTEVLVSNLPFLAGRPDVLIEIESEGSKHKIPVEIKRTDADYFNGVRAYAVWQAIVYMYLLQSEYGYVLTLYNGKRNSYKAWLIVRKETGWQVYNGSTPAKFSEDSDFPRDEKGDNWFSDEQFAQIWEQGVEWSKKARGITEWQDVFDFLSSDGPHTNPLAKPCAGKYVPEEPYKRNSKGGKKGERKPGTGEISELCPLYKYCHRKRLTKDIGDATTIDASVVIGESYGTK